MVWNGKADRADEIDKWARDSGLLPRWQWADGEQARVLVQRPFPDSAEWVVVPVGSTIERVPPHTDEKVEEADFPLRVTPPADFA
jgi:hypothetical protein